MFDELALVDANIHGERRYLTQIPIKDEFWLAGVKLKALRKRNYPP